MDILNPLNPPLSQPFSLVRTEKNASTGLLNGTYTVAAMHPRVQGITIIDPRRLHLLPASPACCPKQSAWPLDFAAGCMMLKRPGFIEHIIKESGVNFSMKDPLHIFMHGSFLKAKNCIDTLVPFFKLLPFASSVEAGVIPSDYKGEIKYGFSLVME